MHPLSQSQPPALDRPDRKLPFISGNRLLALGIGMAVLSITALIFLLFSPWSPFKAAPRNTSLTVGDNPYLYICSLFDSDTVARELGLNRDKNAMNIKETFAMLPATGHNKPVDLLQLGSALHSIDSSCTLKFDRQYATGADGQKTASFINVTADAKQFKDTSTAQKAFGAAKQQTIGAKPLPDFADTGFYTAPITAQQTKMQYALHTIQHKNLLVTYTVPLEENDTQGERSAAQLSRITTELVRRIDSGAGEQPADYSAVVSYKGQPLIDSCHALDDSHLQRAIQPGLEFNPLSFSTSAALAPEDNNSTVPTHISSACRVLFRTAADTKAQAEANLKPETDPGAKLAPGESYAIRYPHTLIIQAITSENTSTAKKLISYYKQQSQEHAKNQPRDSLQVSDASLGDQAIHVTTNPSASSDATSSTDIYYIAKDHHVFIITASFARQTKPYPIGAQNISPESAQGMLEVLIKAAHHAERKAT